MSSYRPTPLQFQRLEPDEMMARVRAYADAMHRRRTVRHFSTEPVPEAVVVEAIRAAASAPSGANQQPWTYVLVSDPTVKRELREAAEHEERRSWEERMPAAWLEALDPLGIDWHKPHLTDAPLLVVVFARVWGSAEGRRTKHYYVDESVGISVGILLSALHLGGLATLTHTPSPMGFLRELLGRPENERPFLLIPVGYPAPDAQVPDLSRRPLEDVLVRR